MKRSEIFDSFVKIAQEKGMISNDSSEAKKKIEQTGRAGSDDISTIEALYGVKPDSDIKYDNNIMEAAHPNSVVVSPSYDKLNGLVENHIERQNILHNIVMKPVNGLSTQHKYAEKELLLSLVRIGNDLDNQRQEELRALADTCLEQLASKKKLKKQAWIPLAIGLIAATVGGIYAQQHLPNISRGLLKDYQSLDTALNKFLTANSNWGIGHDYDEQVKQDVTNFRAKLAQAMQVYNANSEALRQFEQLNDASTVIKAQSDAKTQQAIKAKQDLDTLVEQMSTYTAKQMENFSSDVYKSRHTKNTGAITNFLEYTHVQGGKDSLAADDFENVVTAIPPFMKSLMAVANVFNKSDTIQQQVASEMSAAQSGQQKPQESNEEQNSGGRTVQDVDNEVEHLGENLEMFNE